MSKGRTTAMAASICFVHPLFASIRKYARISVGSVALLLLAIGMVFCAPASAQSTTTISGNVYAPNGVDPLVNVLVYVTTSPVSPPVAGANCPGVNCQTALNAVPIGVTAFADSAVDGSFTLTGVPDSDSYTLVIQAGKWQRQFLNVPVGTTAITGLQLAMPTVHGTVNGSMTSSLPTSQAGGPVMTVNTIPLIAISTGSADAMECVLRDVGIADTEFTDDNTATATTGGRIHLYQGAVSAGAFITSSTPSESALTGGTSTTPLNDYDMAMFPCQGSATTESTTGIQNLIAYSSAGGRIFATHFSFDWMSTDTFGIGDFAADTFSGAVNWSAGNGLNQSAPGPATINTSFTDGSTLAQWMTGVGASTTPGQVELSNLRNNLNSVNPPTQIWSTLNSGDSATPNPDIMQLTFNMPVGADLEDQFGRVLYNEYHVEDGSKKIAFPAECGTGPAFSVADPPPLAPSQMSAQEKMLEYSLFDLSNFVVAVINPTATISITPNPTEFKEGDTGDTITANVTNTSSTVALPANTIFTILLPTGVTATAMTDPTGGWNCTVGTLTCTRTTALNASTSDSVIVTVSVSSTATGGEPTSMGTVTAQIASPNFSSNVSSPITITLVEAAAVSWATPAPITFGTPLSATQLDAVGNAPDGAGTYVYSPALGAILSAGSQTLTVMYMSGNISFPGTGMGSVTLQVNPAVATVMLSGLTQTFGSPSAVTATTSTPTLTPVTFTYTYTGIGSTVYGPSSTPPTADGSYTVVATIVSGENYTGSATGTLVISGQATLDVTATTVQPSPNPVMAGQPVTLTATIADVTNPGTVPTGTVTFTDTTTNTVLNGGTAVNLNNGVATLTGVVLSGGGMHTITAAYSGLSGFFASSTNSAQEQVGLSSPVAAPLLGYPVTVTITGEGTSANISVVTMGAQNLDFTDAITGDTCVSNLPEQGQTCTVNVNFTPKYAGPRYGAVVITDVNGNVLGTAYLQAVGTGPQVTIANTTQGNLTPNSVSTLGGSFVFSNPTGMAIDASGDVFIADAGNHAVEKIPFTAGVYGAPITLASSFTFNSPYGVAVDGAGNVFVSDNGGQAMYEILAAGGYTTVNPLGNSTSNSNPKGIAVDGAANVYVAGSNNNVYEVLAAGGYTTVNELGGGFLNPSGVAVDAVGNIFVADTNNNLLKEMPAGCASSTCVTTLLSNIGYSTGLAIDGADDLYVANGALMEFLAGGSYATSFSLSPSISNAPAIAVASNGNVFFTNGNAVEEFDYVDAPALAYPTSTPLGEQDTTDGTQTVTVSNIGNVPLTFASVNYPGDFPEANGASGACSSSTQLAMGTGCALPVNLAPTSTTGLLSESLVLTDNNLNATTTPGTQQTIALSGTALAALTATQAVASSVLNEGHAITPFTPVTGSGGTAPLMYSVSPGLPAGLTFNTNTGAITGTPTVTSALMSYTVTVTDENGATAAASFSLTVSGGVVAVQSIGVKTLMVYQAGTPFIPVTGSGGTAPLTYSVSPGLPAGLTLNANTGVISGTAIAVSAAASYTVTVTDANGATAAATFSLGVVQQASVTAVSANPATATAGQAVTLTAMVSATVTGTPVTPTGTVTFFDNGTQLGSVVNLVNGVATLNVASLPPGQAAMITAVYSGDGNFLTSTSTNSASVGVAVLDFTFTNAGVAAYTAAPGAVAAYNFALAPLNSGGYPGTVSFTVTGLPAGATASFTPSSEAANGGAVPVGMTVQTATATAHNDNHGNSTLGQGVVLALLLLPFGMKRSVRERLKGRMLLLVLLLAGTTAAMSGCASNNGFMLQSPQTYTLIVTATSGAVQHSQTVTLIVQ
jgi:Bacterial Ig-like domain (group 3)/MBG domain/Putative Ig domain/NHL repeat